jgi:hypothetical protein
MTTETPDRLNMRVWAMIALVGAILCIIGWYRYFAS